MFKQADNILQKFGGPLQLAKMLNIAPATVYRWTYPREKGGTNGVVPAKWINRIHQLADTENITLTNDDWRIF